MNDNNKLLLILERSGENLKLNKRDSGEYILEGVFAQFGIENNNKRIYEEKEYLPHLEYLQKKVSENRLMGELDHPDKFEISLDKVSHIVEHLEYDKSKRQIKGRVRVLDTPSGNIARNLIDSGVPISISSRAAGTVNENKKVKINKIFTYDLVADPGFEGAQLTRINESLGLNTDDNLQIFDATGWDSTYKLTENKDTNENMNNQENPKNYVTVDSLDRYSILISNEIKKINERLNQISGTNIHSESQEVTELKEQIKELNRYNDKLQREIQNSIKYSDYLGTKLDESIRYSDYLGTKLNETIDYAEKEVGRGVNNIIGYVTEEVAPHVDKLIKHNNYLAEKMNLHMDYVDKEIVPMLDESIKHNDYLAGEIQKNRDYAEYIASLAVSDRNFKDLVEYTEYMFESQNGGFKGKLHENLNEDNLNEGKQSFIKDNPTPENVKERVTNLTNNIDAVLEQIKKEKIEKLQEQSKVSTVYNLISEENREIYSKLDETQKQKVTDALLGTKSSVSSVLNETFTNVLNENQEPLWLSKAPENYRKVYESLSPEGKQKIIAAAEWYSGKLENDYQILNFWQTRGLQEQVKPEVSDVLNEIKKTNQQMYGQPGVMNTHLGYSANRVDIIKEGLERFK